MRRSLLLPLLIVAGACGEIEAPQSTTDVDFVAAVVQDEANVVDLANDLLAAANSEYRIAYAELLTAEASGDETTKNVIIARDLGNKRLGINFVPGDPRRTGGDGDPNTIDTWVDLTGGATASGLTTPETSSAIARAMTTWDDELCSDLGMNVFGAGADLGLVQAILGFGGGVVTSDIMHAGWLPGAFFDLLRPNGARSILGVTFTLTFVSGDLDGNGLPDLGAREIYYNDAFSWADDGSSNFDVETVALHEAGHALSQAHFGKIFANPNSGKLVFSPLAVMNASYSRVNRTLEGTDGAGHCSNWGSWPNLTGKK
jgi:hypothetical protein